MAREKTRTINVGLLRSGTAAKHGLQRALAGWPAHTIHVHRVRVGSLHLAPSSETQPAWADLLSDADEDPARGLLQRHESAVLVIERGKRTFVLPFGQGRHQVPDEIVESRFGRRVTLNAINPAAVRTVDNLKLDGASRNARMQAARPATLREFDLNPSAEIVKGLGGRAVDPSFATRVSGTTYAQVTGALSLLTLPSLLDRCVEYFKSDAYQVELGWIDQIEVITDKMQVARLDDELLKLWRSGDEGLPLWLAVPEVVEWDDFRAFAITSAPKPQRDLDDLFLRSARDAFNSGTPTIEQLRKARVEMRRTSHPARTWQLYRCLYAEVNEGPSSCILHDGDWYRVDDDLVASVNAAISSIPRPTLALPAWPLGHNEAAFNLALAAANAGAIHGDRRLVGIGGSRIEVCDVLGAAGELVHVKKYANSATLSHLFAQGLNSAEALGEAPFRAAAAAALAAPAAFAEPWRPASHPVVYLIGSKSRRTALSLNLPFFSRLTLYNALPRLRGRQHPVQLGGVHIS